ncbi:hypothetical protein HDU92_000579 [Lobulomyces angularis]|nr:hypothetical protein HDU92_000579 [Lobulomyces angularis]
MKRFLKFSIFIGAPVVSTLVIRSHYSKVEKVPPSTGFNEILRQQTKQNFNNLYQRKIDKRTIILNDKNLLINFTESLFFSKAFFLENLATNAFEDVKNLKLNSINNSENNDTKKKSYFEIGRKIGNLKVEKIKNDNVDDPDFILFDYDFKIGDLLNVEYKFYLEVDRANGLLKLGFIDFSSSRWDEIGQKVYCTMLLESAARLLER